MKHLTIVLVLVLASTNASKYFRPEHQLQQDSMTRNGYLDIFPIALEENRLLSGLSSLEDLAGNPKWESPPDPRTHTGFYADLDTLESILQEDPDEMRMKRMKTSLSIDNPLDVLRQQYYRALARRMKFKSIEKNREHLIKTGKRSSAKDSADFPGKTTSQKNYLDNGDSERYSIRGSSETNSPLTSNLYKTRMDDHSYQT